MRNQHSIFSKPSLLLSGTITLILLTLLLWTKWLPGLINMTGFEAHGYCFYWNPGVLSLFVGSDSLIGIAYVAISITLMYFVIRTRRDIPFQWIFVAFGIFIIACGTTHFFDIVTLWLPVYWLSGAIRGITAVASVATAAALPPLLPKIFRVIEIAKVSEERKHQLEQAHHQLAFLYAKVENALELSEQRYGYLAETVPVLIWITLPDRRIEYCNQRWQEYTGLQPELADEQLWQRIIHPDDLSSFNNHITLAHQSAQPYEIESRIQQSTGSYRWHLIRTLPITDRSGNVTSWVGTATDIDAQKRIEEELRQSQQRKDAFLSMASHELKTPITSIKAFTQILQKMLLKENKPLAVQYLTKMETQINKLITLISNLLDISKIEEGQIELNNEEFDIDELLRENIDMLQHTTTTHTIRLLKTVHACIRGDKDRLGQVIINLVNNAAKYSPSAQQVDIEVESDHEQVTVHIRDYGIGIPKEHQPHIFERFYRVYNDKDQKFPGLGIGLYIAAEIVQRHQGRIWVKSTGEGGSTFSFSLPLLSTRGTDN